MAASIVQPDCVCTCNCAGHVHHHDRHPYPFYGAPGLTGYPVLAGFPVPTGPSSNNAGAVGAAAEQHIFATAPAITTVSGVSEISVTEPRVYPLKGGHVKHTHASFRKESLPELTPTIPANQAMTNSHAQTNGTAHPSKVLAIPITPLSSSPSQSGEAQSKATNSWALCLPIPVPHGLPNTTLESLTYTIRYASFNAGSASVQTDVVVTHGSKLAEGVMMDYAKVPLYSHYGSGPTGGGYGPPMLNEALGMALLSVPAFKNAGGNGGWSHYLDHQKVYPNVRIGEGESYASVAAAHTHVHAASHHAGHAHTQAADGCHVYLFFHVYEYPGADALRSLSVDVSATWNDGEALRKAKEERAREVNELRVESERLVFMKKEVEMTIEKLEESVRLANLESEKRLKGEIEMEQELKEREEELLELETKAKESYKGRLSEEEERLRQLERKEKEAEAMYAKRMKEEQERLKAFEQAEANAKAEHEKRMQQEVEKLKEITLAEERAKAEHEKRASEMEEAQRKFKQEAEADAERRAHDEAEWKAHEEAERKAREDQERWAKEQAALRQKEEEERQSRIEAERKAKEEADKAAKAAAARVVPSIAEAPHVADDKMQEHIAAVAAKMGQKCKNGYAWEKKAHGYKCSGGGHFISFKDLGMQ